MPAPAVMMAADSHATVIAATVPRKMKASRRSSLGARSIAKKNAVVSATAVCWNEIAAAISTPTANGQRGMLRGPSVGSPRRIRTRTMAPAQASGAIIRLSGTASSASTSGRPRITPASSPASSARRGVYRRPAAQTIAATAARPEMSVSTCSPISLDPKSCTSKAIVQSIPGGLLFQVCEYRTLPLSSSRATLT